MAFLLCPKTAYFKKKGVNVPNFWDPIDLAGMNVVSKRYLMITYIAYSFDSNIHISSYEVFYFCLAVLPTVYLSIGKIGEPH